MQEVSQFERLAKQAESHYLPRGAAYYVSADY